jgi:murein DD-endopeptidase MepM/ murein hydrolase activator NlpD
MKHTLFEWGIGATAAVLLGSGLIFAASAAGSDGSAGTSGLPDPRALLSTLTSFDHLENNLPLEKTLSIRRNETLSGLLDRIGAPREEANGAVYAAGQLMDLRKVRPGENVTAWLETDPADGQVRLTGLSLRPEAERQVLVSRTTSGDWVSHELLAKLTPGINYVAGQIEQSIYETALSQGATDQQVVDYADVFGYDIDFQREMRSGDTFSMLYETYVDERGEPVKTGALLYASMDGEALKKQFYRFTPADDGQVDYFDETGQSAKKFLMKTPINGARLSSSFGNRRHPILGYTKLHKGTDFAAPPGTPIYAAGNGRIERAGPFGSYGNYIRIRHANGYQTAYAHMKGFARGMRPGAVVKQGQVIGYVGTTGRSTGPHLHYEVYINNKPVNAMSLKLPTGRKLEGEPLEAFLAERDRIDALRDGTRNELFTVSTDPAADPSGGDVARVNSSGTPDARPPSIFSASETR